MGSLRLKKVINIPDLGDADNLEVIEICVNEGDQVNIDDPLIVLESEKAAMEIPASSKGKITSIIVSNGDEVSKGMPFIEMELDDSSNLSEIEETQSNVISETTQINEKKEINIDQNESGSETFSENEEDNKIPINFSSQENTKIYAGPAVRKLAREFGIDLSKVLGSGPKNRILKSDLHKFNKEILASKTTNLRFELPDIDFSSFGPVTFNEFSKFERTSLNNLLGSWNNIPHVTQHSDIEFDLVSKLRRTFEENLDKKISPLAFIVYAVTLALKDFPLLNSSISKDLQGYYEKKFINIGIAVDTDYGLVVPNIKSANELCVEQISDEIKSLADKAQKRRLGPDQLKGGTFTISSLGGFQGKFFTPIINLPEVAILGVSKTYKSIKMIDEYPQETEILPVSLSYDHRIINGVYAVKFLSKLNDIMTSISTFER